jgi:methyl-accepting chemotaxis protein
MKLRNQVLMIGLAGAIVSACVGAVGLFSADQLVDTFNSSKDMNIASQSSQAAAALHGAIRGDVQRAMLGAIGRDPAQIEEAARALTENIEKLDAAIATLDNVKLSKEAKEVVLKTIPAAKAYTASASRVIDLTKADTAAAAAIPEFQKLYGELAKQMNLQVAAIAKDEEAFASESKKLISASRVLVVLALIASTVTLVGAALWVARTMSSPMAEAVKVSQRLAEGDLTAEISPNGNFETTQLLTAMSEMQSSFESIVRSVKANADMVASASAEIAQGNHDLSSRTEIQASSLEQTAASMEELNSTVHQNAQSAHQGNQLARNASSVAAKGGEIVGQVVATMKGINESSKKIADIIGVIDGIAFQTNILALNAAVEAARAGEQGRGFAVVASEVRSLAGRSAEAAKEIKSLINASVERVERGSALVDQAGATMTEVVQSVAKVSEIMAEISGASSEQSNGVAQIGEAIKHMDEATQQNAALVEEMAASASSLKSQAQELVGAVAVFKVKDPIDQASTDTYRPGPRTLRLSPQIEGKKNKTSLRLNVALPKTSIGKEANSDQADWTTF